MADDSKLPSGVKYKRRPLEDAMDKTVDDVFPLSKGSGALPRGTSHPIITPSRKGAGLWKREQ